MLTNEEIQSRSLKAETGQNWEKDVGWDFFRKLIKQAKEANQLREEKSLLDAENKVLKGKLKFWEGLAEDSIREMNRE